MPIVIVGLIACVIGFTLGTVFAKSSNSGDPDHLERMRVVYLVTYSIDGCEPTHTIFDNKENADKMENYLRHRDCKCDYVLNEVVPVFNQFLIM